MASSGCRNHHSVSQNLPLYLSSKCTWICVKGKFLWVREISRPHIAKLGQEYSREGGWEFPTTTSAHRWHAAWLHAWRRHHPRHFLWIPVTRKGPPVNKTLYIAVSIWQRHSIVYPDVYLGSTSQAWFWGVAGVFLYRACMKMPEAECVLVITWVKSSLWKWEFTKAPARTLHCSWWFWKPSPKSFIHGFTRKTCMQMTWSFLNHWWNYKRSWSSRSLAWKERGCGSKWEKNKVLLFGPGLNMRQKSSKNPCAVCLKAVGTNSIFCGCSSS